MPKPSSGVSCWAGQTGEERAAPDRLGHGWRSGAGPRLFRVLLYTDADVELATYIRTHAQGLSGAPPAHGSDGRWDARQCAATEYAASARLPQGLAMARSTSAWLRTNCRTGSGSTAKRSSAPARSRQAAISQSPS